jgi:hypothetical protein
MTLRELIEVGTKYSHRSDRYVERDLTRFLWNQYSTEFRYHQLVQRLRERRSLIRTANRKFRRQCGLSLRNA